MDNEGQECESEETHLGMTRHGIHLSDPISVRIREAPNEPRNGRASRNHRANEGHAAALQKPLVSGGKDIDRDQDATQDSERK